MKGTERTDRAFSGTCCSAFIWQPSSTFCSQHSNSGPPSEYCSIDVNSALADERCSTPFFTWNEIMITPRQKLEAVDWTFVDFTCSKSFGGKVFVRRGEFGQIWPAVKAGN